MKKNLIAIALVGMLAAGCGSSDSSAMAVFDTSSGSAMSNRAIATAEYAVDEAAYEEEVASAAEYYDGADLDEGYTVSKDEEAAGGSDGSTGSEGSESESEIAEVDTSKKIVYNMTYNVETTDLDQLDAAIQAKVNALGGYVENMSVDGSNYSDPYYGTEYASSTSYRYAYYTVRIPAAKLNEFAESVEEGSNVLSRSKSTQDITSSYIDTDSRRKSLEEELEVLNDMAAQATTVDELIQIEAQRTEVRADLENIKGQLKSMDERVSYSTVDINVTEVKVLTDTTDKDLSWQERIANGFQTSCENLIETTQEIVIWIASNIPMILFWIIMLIIILVILRIVVAIAAAILGIRRGRKDKKDNKKDKKDKQNDQGRIRNDHRETERREIDTDEHADRTEDRDHVVQTTDDEKSN